MSDQNAATALTAAAVVAVVLIARAAVLHHGRRARGAVDGRPRHRTHPHAGTGPPFIAAPADDAAHPAVREAEKHVHRCWQQLHAPPDPTE
ncbi:hypothetical protein ACWDA7_45085 [Streptomyces sp. NPDC001156]